MAMQNGIDIGALETFTEGIPHPVWAGERDLVVVRKGNELFAVRDVCPHQGARLSTGILTGDVPQCRPGEQPDLVRDGEFLACPWHGWKIDVRTGCSVVDSDIAKVRSYPVQIEGDRVFVDIGSR